MAAFKALLGEPDGVDTSFVRERTAGFEEAAASARTWTWEELEGGSGTSQARMRDFARLLIAHPNANFVWSMGLTQHAHGVDTVRALVNVGLARGLPGRPCEGSCHPRHSGSRGAEVGCVPQVDRGRGNGGRGLGLSVGDSAGWSAAEQATRPPGERSRSSGSWAATSSRPYPTPTAGEGPQSPACGSIRTRPLLRDAGRASDTVLLSGVHALREPGGVTETSTERRIIFSPEIPGRRIAGARPEWEVFRDVCTRAWPERAGAWNLESTAALREEMSRAIPLYKGIETLSRAGEQVQWGGLQLYADGRFATPDEKAHFAPFRLRQRTALDGRFRVSTRRGKQFNSMDAARPRPADRRLARGRADERVGCDGARPGQGTPCAWRRNPGSSRAPPHRADQGRYLEVHWPEGWRCSERGAWTRVGRTGLQRARDGGEAIRDEAF